jgi:hypothetical protein
VFSLKLVDMKKILYLLSLFLTLNSCVSVRVGGEKKQDFKIKENLFILTHDNPSARDFIVSLKNYLALNIEGRKIKVAKYNIFQDEKYDVVIPNLQYIMDVKLDNIEMGIKSQIILNGSFTINIQDYKTKEIVWTSQVLIKRIFDSDKISTAKKIAEKIVENLDKDLIFK